LLPYRVAVGVGRRCTPITSGSDPFPFATCRAAPGDPGVAHESIARGVGRSITAEGIIRSPELPRWFGPPFVPSVACGVGRRVGNDEQPLAPVGGSHGGRWYAAPPCVIPDRGQVPDHSGKSSSKVASDVLQHDESRSQVAYGVPDGGPDPAVIVSPQPLAGGTVGLARVASGHDVHRLHGGPVHGGQVPVVRHVRPVVREYLGGGL
jgi:hypothetical protein